MSGIYLHIPFCKQACNYCDFHFSTSIKRKDEMLLALKRELELRREELDARVRTIYLGGGTPSLLTPMEAEDLFSHIYGLFEVDPLAEITLEANPDDLDRRTIGEWAKTPVNRLSIGIQSFHERDLRFMNRAHDRQQALDSLTEAFKHFENISIDLIYGIPGMSIEQWKENLRQTFEYPVRHISSYALTVEPRTALHHQIRTGKCAAPGEEDARLHFEILMEEADKQGFLHYEVSNFAKQGYLSRHNTSYWQGEPYLGIGPSAHSYSGDRRSWNISNNVKYIKALGKGDIDLEEEVLTREDRMNEMIMTRLRTMWGMSLQEFEARFGKDNGRRLRTRASRFVEAGLLELNEDRLLATRKGFFLIDGMASDLFFESTR